MPSPRRMRLLGLAAAATVVFVLFYRSGLDSSSVRDGQAFKDFYSRTHAALERNPRGQSVVDTETGKTAGTIPADKDADGDVDEDDRKVAAEMQAKLKDSAQKAKDDANKKGGLKPDIPQKIVGVGSSREGQVKDNAEVPAAVAPGADTPAKKEPSKSRIKQSEEEETAQTEFVRMVKKAPVVIFSKSYCPFSKRAKGILLEKYNIDPEPFVVELDEHKLGQDIQDLLKAKTGRRTVPNVLINGASIGGADDIVELDEKGELSNMILSLGDDRVRITKRFVSSNSNQV